jgi:hypothetical protein
MPTAALRRISPSFEDLVDLFEGVLRTELVVLHQGLGVGERLAWQVRSVEDLGAEVVGDLAVASRWRSRNEPAWSTPTPSTVSCRS